MQWLSRAPKQSFEFFWQALLGLVPTAVSGTLLMAFLVQLLVSAGFTYPFKADIDSSRFGQIVQQTVKVYRR
jgi:hypothetical protein